MPLQTSDALKRSLARGERGGVFFLFGDEEFLKEELAAEIVAAHLDPATRDFNFDQLRGGDVTPESLASIVQTPPMMAAWRVVVVREAQGLATSARLRETIEALLGSAPPDLALVLIAQLPPRTKARFYERLKKEARSVDLAALSQADLPGWLMARSGTDGVHLEPDAARALAAAIGADLGVLIREMAKLRDFVGDRARITVADVEKAVGPIARENRWEWFDRVAEGRFAEARRGLPTLLESGENGVGLVIGLGVHFLRLALAVEGGERALADALPPHQKWLARRVAQQARRWSADSLEGALDDLLRADRLLKSASLGDAPLIEELLLRFEARAA